MRVILFGYYGFGNAGDEAVLAGLLQGLRRFGPEQVEYIALSGNPRETERLHQVASRPRNDWRTLLDQSGGADAWVFGGGSLLQDVSGPLTMPYYLGVMSLLHLRRQRLFFHAQGVGPIQGPFNRRFTGRLLRRAARISVRDPHSAETLSSLGVPSDLIYVGADLAFLLPPPHPVGSEGDKRPVIGLAVREWSGWQQWAPELVAGARRFMAHTDATLMVIPMDEPADRALAEQIAYQFPGRSVIAGPGMTFKEKMALVASCDLVVAMRLHAGIFAALAQTPALLVAYDPKVEAFGQTVGFDVVPVENVRREEIAHRLEQTWLAKEQASQRLITVTEQLKGRAEADIRALTEAIFAAASVNTGQGRT